MELIRTTEELIAWNQITRQLDHPSQQEVPVWIDRRTGYDDNSYYEFYAASVLRTMLNVMEAE